MNHLTPAQDGANNALSEDMTRTVNILSGIPERFYEGQRVITAKEAAEILQLTPRAIQYAHSKEGFLQEGVDYFEVTQEEVTKLNFATSELEENKSLKFAPQLRLYTREGFGQLCNYSRTATAMKIRSIALRMLFKSDEINIYNLEKQTRGRGLGQIALPNDAYLQRYENMSKTYFDYLEMGFGYNNLFSAEESVFQLICSLCGSKENFFWFYTYMSLGFTIKQAGKKAGIKAIKYNAVIQIMKQQNIKVYKIAPAILVYLAHCRYNNHFIDMQRFMDITCGEVRL